MLVYVTKIENEQTGTYYGVYDSDDKTLEYISEEQVIELFERGYKIAGVICRHGELISAKTTLRSDVLSRVLFQKAVYNNNVVRFVNKGGTKLLASCGALNLDKTLNIDVSIQCFRDFDFEGLTQIKLTGGTGLIDCSFMFRNSNLSKIDLFDLDTSGVIDMTGMFYNCKNLKMVNLGNCNTDNVQYFENMFYGCDSLESIHAKNFDLSKILSVDGSIRWVDHKVTVYK